MLTSIIQCIFTLVIYFDKIKKMSSNNLDEKLLLQYITKCFQNWGMTYISTQLIKKSKKNDDEAIQPMTKLMFHLSLLHIFNYQYLISELNIKFHEKEEEMLEIVLAHLYQIQCPFIIVKQGGKFPIVSFDFTSSKYILITCGWIMGVSNFFNQTLDKLFKKQFVNIYKPKPLNFNTLAQKYSNVVKNINLHQNADKLTRISYLAKILKVRKYSLECLMEKKGKIIKKLKKELKEMELNLQIEDILSSKNEEVEDLQEKLRESLQFEKQNMGYRKYWWIWLDQKIIASQYAELPTHFQNFQKLQAMPNSIKYNISIDLQYVSKYLQSLDEAEGKLQTIDNKINALQIKGQKKFRQIQREIIQQIKSIQENQSQDVEIPSFIGMQLQKYINLQQKVNQIPKQSKKTTNKSVQKSNKKLAESIKSFIEQIDAIVLI